MNTTRFLTATGLAAALLGGMLALPLASAADSPLPLPQYQFQVGQELLYSGNSESKYEGGQDTVKSTWRVWVVRQNKESGWRLVIRYGSIWRAQGIHDDKKPLPELVSFSYCDLRPNGRMDESFGCQLMLPVFAPPQLSRLLPPLPENEDQARQGWTVKESQLGETLRCRLLPEPAGTDRRGLEVVRDTPARLLNGESLKEIVTFDTQPGLPEKIVSQKRWSKGKNVGVIKLDEIKTHDADWARRINADAENYFAALQVYKKPKSTADLTAALDGAVAKLKATRLELKISDFQKKMEQIISHHDGYAKLLLREANIREEALNQPAIEWSTTDFDGKTHALKDYRGRVVILDFWFRRCGPCLRSMPQMKQITDYFEGKPVVLLGMNVDEKEEDARFVIHKMGLNYRNLKARGLLEKYNVQGCPTLLILDQQGIVRDIHTGYSPTLKDEVVRSVERLLQAKP